MSEPDPASAASTATAPPPREHWGTRLGFLMAAVGSAVGLGNMWRFSYLTAENGGAAFVLLYVGFTLVVGLPVLLVELTLGRGAGKSPIAALVHYGSRRWGLLGIMILCICVIVLAMYSVISGWSLRYTLEAVTLGFVGDSATHFGEISTGPSAAGWHLLFMAVTATVVAGGIRRGIERVALVLMPLLLLVICGIAVYAATLDGAAGGYRYYLEVDFHQVASWKVISAAASQAFFSLGIGAGVMLTYASYLTERDHLPNESVVIALSDFGVAFVAGLAVFPLIFALGLSGAVGESAFGALFITLRSAFAELGAAGSVVGFVFFAALTVAALTSAISVLEVLVASAIDQLGWSRRRAALIAGAVVGLVGLAPALDIAVLGWMDTIGGNVMLLAAGLAFAILVGWSMEDPMAEVSKGAGGTRWFGLWLWLLRIPVPVVLAVVLYGSITSLFG